MHLREAASLAINIQGSSEGFWEIRQTLTIRIFIVFHLLRNSGEKKNYFAEALPF